MSEPLKMGEIASFLDSVARSTLSGASVEEIAIAIGRSVSLVRLYLGHLAASGAVVGTRPFPSPRKAWRLAS